MEKGTRFTSQSRRHFILFWTLHRPRDNGCGPIVIGNHVDNHFITHRPEMKQKNLLNTVSWVNLKRFLLVLYQRRPFFTDLRSVENEIGRHGPRKFGQKIILYEKS